MRTTSVTMATLAVEPAARSESAARLPRLSTAPSHHRPVTGADQTVTVRDQSIIIRGRVWAHLDRVLDSRANLLCGCLGCRPRHLSKRDEWLAVLGVRLNPYGYPSTPSTLTGAMSATFHMAMLPSCV